MPLRKRTNSLHPAVDGGIEVDKIDVKALHHHSHSISSHCVGRIVLPSRSRSSPRGAISWNRSSHPWLRAGYALFSGDGDAKNGQHDAFIPLVDTARIYSRFPLYTEANLKDAFVELMLKPTRRLTLRSHVHDLRLASNNDLRYSSAGAYDNSTFGYTGRTSNGKSSLGTLYNLSADYQVGKHTSCTFYLGYMRGGDVIGKIYSGKDTVYAYLEATQRF
jgi:hypothetical protein